MKMERRLSYFNENITCKLSQTSPAKAKTVYGAHQFHQLTLKASLTMEKLTFKFPWIMFVICLANVYIYIHYQEIQLIGFLST